MARPSSSARAPHSRPTSQVAQLTRSLGAPVASAWADWFRQAYERGGLWRIGGITTGVSTAVSVVITFVTQTLLDVPSDLFRVGITSSVVVPLLIAPLVTIVLARMTDHLMALEIVLGELATRDPLTGAHNRRWIMDQCLTRAGVPADGKDLSLAPAAGGILMIDVDHFKSINDRHGHPVGDQVLKAVAQTLGATLRASDAFGRYGGEEFLVLTSDRDADALGHSAEALRRAIERMVADPERPELKVTASLGAALLPGTGGETALATTLQQADAALYRAKAGGRNRVVGDGIGTGAPVPTDAGPVLNNAALAAGT